LNHAKEAGVVRDNLETRLISKFHKQTKRVHDEVELLTSEEVSVFLQDAVEQYPHFYPLLLCTIHTGMRPRELAGLHWGDIDFHGRFRRSIVHGKANSTKTSKVR
jgi:integrase